MKQVRTKASKPPKIVKSGLQPIKINYPQMNQKSFVPVYAPSK